MLDMTRYVPPGVYVDAGDTPTLVTPGIDPTVLALIGTGVGYHTFSEVVSFDSVSAVQLTKQGINTSSIAVTGFIADPGAPSQSIPATFQVTEDYTVGVTGTGTTTVTTITRVGGGDIEDEYPEVTVTYRYTDASYHQVNVFEDLAGFIQIYGPPLDPATGAISSPLSLAAQTAMGLNGATRIYAVALNGTGTLQEQFSAAYNLLAASSPEANLVVPLWDTVVTGTVLQGMLQTLKAWLNAEATAGNMRTAVVGFDSGYAGTPTDVATLATQAASERIIMTWPNQLTYYNQVALNTETVDGFYLAAACAGVMTAQPLQVPLTRKFPQGFAGLPVTVRQSLTKLVKDQLSSSGITVVEQDRSGALVVRHGLTTNFAGGILKREISIVRARDGLYNLIYDTLTSTGIVGDPIGQATALQVKGIVIGALEEAQGSGLVYAYKDVLVREQIAPNGDPTIIDVRFSYRPTYPLNYIVATFTVDTTTGNITDTEVAA